METIVAIAPWTNDINLILFFIRAITGKIINNRGIYIWVTGLIRVLNPIINPIIQTK